MSLEDLFKSWGGAPSQTERQKMDNAESAIRKAINANFTLSKMDISVIPQGSYRAKTNVKQDSDVDVCICLNSIFFPHYPEGKSKEYYGNIDGSISFNQYRDLIEKALKDYFSSQSVIAGNKAFDIHSNSYRVDADVVPALAYRHYYGNGQEDYYQPAGVAFLTRNEGKKIINWPHHSYENGKNKHDRTGQRFRKIVRIVKRLRNKMQEDKIASANNVASFLIESLIWNAPDNYFNHNNYSDDVREVLAYCFNDTLPQGKHGELGEVNDKKYLFGSHQPWTREQAHNFFSSAWDYLGFK
jgi:hypothetical protein